MGNCSTNEMMCTVSTLLLIVSVFVHSEDTRSQLNHPAPQARACSARPRAVLFSWEMHSARKVIPQTQFNPRTNTEITSPNCAASARSLLPFHVKSGRRKKWKVEKRRFIIDVFPWNSPSSPQHRLTLRWKKSFFCGITSGGFV